MALRNGTYVREMDGARLLFYSWQNWNDASVALYSDKNARDFTIVWDEKEQAELYLALEMTNLQPGEWVEINGGMVA